MAAITALMEATVPPVVRAVEPVTVDQAVEPATAVPAVVRRGPTLRHTLATVPAAAVRPVMDPRDLVLRAILAPVVARDTLDRFEDWQPEFTRTMPRRSLHGVAAAVRWLCTVRPTAARVEARAAVTLVAAAEAACLRFPTTAEAWVLRVVALVTHHRHR